MFNYPLLSKSVIAFLSFCAASSSIYFINDLIDIEKDRLHPFKKNRPIASGKISKPLAIAASLIIVLISFYFAKKVSYGFTIIIAVFYLLHLSYSFFLKNIILLDILAIATGFILRVFGGEIATGYHINIWLLLTMISAALFLAVGKRRSELTLLSGWEGTVPAKTRATLLRYSEKMLDVYISMFANSTWITYAFYTFLATPATISRPLFNFFVEENNLYFFQDRKWLTITIPFVIYAVMRYLQLIYEKNQGESPEKVILSDRPLILISGLVGGMIFFIIYALGK